MIIFLKNRSLLKVVCNMLIKSGYFLLIPLQFRDIVPFLLPCKQCESRPYLNLPSAAAAPPGIIFVMNILETSSMYGLSEPMYGLSEPPAILNPSHPFPYLNLPSAAAAPPGIIFVINILESSSMCGLSEPPAILNPSPVVP